MAFLARLSSTFLVLRVVTASGSIYYMNLDIMPMICMRSPMSDRGSEPEGGWKSAHLRRDGEIITLLQPPNIRMGFPMDLHLMVREDGISTVRTTTPVVGLTTTVDT